MKETSESETSETWQNCESKNQLIQIMTDAYIKLVNDSSSSMLQVIDSYKSFFVMINHFIDHAHELILGDVLPRLS